LRQSTTGAQVLYDAADCQAEAYHLFSIEAVQAVRTDTREFLNVDDRKGLRARRPMMRFPGRKILRRMIRPIRRRFFPGAIVLGYHRVADASWDPFNLQVKPQHFLEHLEVLQGLREVVSLGELLDRRAAGESLKKYAVLTFDDGYRDFADIVVPAARKQGMPVTVFVASGFVGGQFWWEELAALMAPSCRGRTTLEIRLGKSASMRFGSLDQPDVRLEAANAISHRLISLKPQSISAALDQLRAWAGDDFCPTPAGTPMSPTTLADVAVTPLVEVGAHTVSHRRLEQLSGEDQRAEILGSKFELEELGAPPVRVFSYPFGSFSLKTPRLVKDLGFRCACASMDGSFSGRGDAFRIPRLWAPDLPGADFRRWLGSWVPEAGS
jgi:peptidoglycan/xylan/chitin deacetylase (PgdA/CDA1 family)